MFFFLINRQRVYCIINTSKPEWHVNFRDNCQLSSSILWHYIGSFSIFQEIKVPVLCSWHHPTVLKITCVCTCVEYIKETRMGKYDTYVNKMHSASKTLALMVQMHWSLALGITMLPTFYLRYLPTQNCQPKSEQTKLLVGRFLLSVAYCTACGVIDYPRW